MRVAVCHPQVPFVRGGAEILADGLVDALRARGHQADLVTVPYRWQPDVGMLENVVLWRLLDPSVWPEPPDLVIGTKFPSYVVRHPRKVIWLVHQFRQAYDLHGTPLAQFADDPHGAAMRQTVRDVDARAIGEAERVFTISANTAERLRAYNGISAEVLYPPPQHLDLEDLGDDGFILSVGRLDRAKRVDLLLEALAREPTLRASVIGDGEDRPRLHALADRLGVSDRVRFTGRVDDEALKNAYGTCRAVFYAPIDEDYGMVTVEAHLAGKPIVTTADAGGPLEFVTDGETGLVVDPTPEAVVDALRRLANDPQLARRLGRNGRGRARVLGWDAVVDRLVGAA